MKNKGITLIALIVTIIVLLILAGVSIVFLTGDNGILFKAKNAKNQTDLASQEERNRLSSYEEFLNGGTSRGGYTESNLINGFTVKTDSIGGSSITVNTSGTVSTNNGSKVYGYIILLNSKVVKVTETLPYTITGLSINTSYAGLSIIAIDENSNLKKSDNELSVSTLNMTVQILDYPLFTKNGIVNVKYVNPSNAADYYYGLDLSKDCTAADALDKQAYDGNNSTYYDPAGANATKNKFRFGTDADVYQCCFKVNTGASGIVFSFADGSGYIAYGEGAIVNTDWFHATYYGKGTSAWQGWRTILNTKVYEMKYDSSL